MLAGSKLRTSFEPDSVMEFGFYNNILNCQTRPHNSDGQPLHAHLYDKSHCERSATNQMITTQDHQKYWRSILSLIANK